MRVIFNFLFSSFIVLCFIQSSFSCVQDKLEDTSPNAEKLNRLKHLYLPAQLQNLIEEDAKSWAQKDFCLGDADKIENSWVITFAFYNAFWQYHHKPEVIDELAQQGFYLAQLQVYEKNIDPTLEFIQTTLTKQIDRLATAKEFLKHGIDLLQAHMTFYSQIHAQLAERPIMGTCYDPLRQIEGITLRIHEQIYDLRKRMIRLGNTSFILFLKHNLTFSVGLSDELDVQLYHFAQQAYKKRHGRLHTGRFEHAVKLERFEAFPKLDSSPFNWDQGGRLLSFMHMRPDQITQVESICEKLIQEGDYIWAYNLSLSFDNVGSDVEPEQQEEWCKKALKWRTKAQEYGFLKTEEKSNSAATLQ